MTSGTGALRESVPALDPRRWYALTVISVATLMVVLDVSIVNIALPHAQADLRISDADRQWAVTAYALAFGGLLLPGGRVVDFAGRKRAFLLGLVGFAAASTVGGLAPNAAFLFTGRALQGAFAALLAPAALSLIAVTFTEPRERAKAFGVYGALQGAGGAVGLIAGGVLTQYASWRWCLFVNTPIALVAALAALPTLRESRAEGQHRHDLAGAALVTTGLVAVVWGFAQASEGGWNTAATWLRPAAGLLLLTGFVIVERRVRHPLLPLRVVLDRDRGGALLASLLISSGMFGMMLFLTYYLQVNLGYRPLSAGLAFLPFSIGIIVSATLGAPLVTMVGPKRLMAAGTAVSVLGTLWLTLSKATSGYLPVVLPAMILTGLGLGAFFLALPNAALADVEPSDTGVASALISTTQQVGGAIGPALLNTLYVSASTTFLAGPAHALPRARQLEAYVHGYRAAYIAGATLLAVAFVVILTTLRTSSRAPVKEIHATS
ncbi:MFS transporter [Actinacidiphila glaucinigra]|uniref:MFS transporter n=1 Tax=Actinacidiphila glaucinigra TaxID=235986 RepID=UPI0035DFD4CC